MKSVKLNAILNAFRLTLMVLVPLITYPYVARIFSPDGMGKIAFATSSVAIFTLLASLGIYSYGVREGAKVKGDRVAFSRLALSLTLLNVISTGLSYLIFFSCLYFVPVFYEHKELMALYCIQIGFVALGFDWVFGAFEEYVYITVRQIIVQIVVIILVFALIHTPADIYLYAIIMLISSVGANIFNIFKASKYISFLEIKHVTIIKHIAPIFILFVTSLTSKIYDNLDAILLGFLTDDYQIGIYTVAVKIITILVTFFCAMAPVFIPKIVKISVRNENPSELQTFLKKIFAFIIWLSLPACVGLITLRNNVIFVLAGYGFEESANTMSFLAPIIIVTPICNIIYYNVLFPKNYEMMVFKLTFFVAMINLITCSVLIPCIGAKGAALGSLIAETLGLLVAFVYSKKIGVISLKCLPKVNYYFLGSFVVYITCMLCSSCFDCNRLIFLMLTIAICMMVYFVVLLLLKEPLTNQIIELGVNLVHKKL